MSLNNKQAETQAVVAKLDAGVGGWQPQVESAIQDLCDEVGELRQQLDFLGKSMQASPTTLSPRVPLTDEERKAPLLPTPPTSSHQVAAEGGSNWAHGHGAQQNFRRRASGVVTTLIPTLDKATFESHSVPLHSLENFKSDSEVGEFGFEQGGRQYNHRVPKLDFPKFYGTDPQDWRMRCEHYFDVNNTFPGLWVHVATIYFYGRAASWLRSSRAHVRFPVWDDFCIAVSTKFDRDQHDMLIIQMDTIRQSGTVWEYYEKFDELMNQLLAYDPVISKKYLVHRFTEGLRREIRNAVLLQRPRDLESTLAIASLQEEVLEAPPESGVKDSKGGMHIRSNSVLKGALPLPLPPGKGVLSAVGKVDD